MIFCPFWLLKHCRFENICHLCWCWWTFAGVWIPIILKPVIILITSSPFYLPLFPPFTNKLSSLHEIHKSLHILSFLPNTCHVFEVSGRLTHQSAIFPTRNHFFQAIKRSLKLVGSHRVGPSRSPVIRWCGLINSKTHRLRITSEYTFNKTLLPGNKPAPSEASERICSEY